MAQQISQAVTPPPAVIGISPGRLELTLNPKQTDGAFRLINYSDEPLRIKTSVDHWDLDKDNNIRLIPPTAQSLDQWLIVNPLEFTIPAHESQTVRLSIRPTVKPKPGEHRATLTFDQQIDKTKLDEVKFKFRLHAVVYGLSEPIKRVSQLISVFADQAPTGQHYIGFDINSTGNANVRLTGQMSVWQKANYPGKNKIPMYILKGNAIDIPDSAFKVMEIPDTPVLPNTRRTIKALVGSLPDTQEYIAHVQGALDGKQFKHSFTINSPH